VILSILVLQLLHQRFVFSLKTFYLLHFETIITHINQLFRNLSLFINRISFIDLRVWLYQYYVTSTKWTLLISRKGWTPLEKRSVLTYSSQWILNTFLLQFSFFITRLSTLYYFKFTQARTGSLAIEDMDGGTFTISNGGVFGSLMGTPIINPPQSAILGMHGIFERPVAIYNFIY